MATGLMKLPENRVRRNYTGGAGIDRLHGKARQEDNNMPEEWVGSMVEASNPDTEFDIYKYVYNAIRKGEKFPVTIEQAAEVVRITEIVKNNSEFKMQEKKTAKATTAAKKGTRRK